MQVRPIVYDAVVDATRQAIREVSAPPPPEIPVEAPLDHCNCLAPDPDPEGPDACRACGGLI